MDKLKIKNTDASAVERPSTAGAEPVSTETTQKEKPADAAASKEPQQQSEASTDAGTAPSEQASNPFRMALRR